MDLSIPALLGLVVFASGCSPSTNATGTGREVARKAVSPASNDEGGSARRDAPLAARADEPPSGSTQAVVVELFSSEGCSSCPPADTVLRRLAETQPVPGARVIALELHVDYWNYLGWSDPFSSAAYTARQHAYTAAFGQRGAYTPQMVVDGSTEFVGSHEDAARTAIARAARSPKARVELSRRDDRIVIDVQSVPDPGGEVADVWLAITEDGIETAVPRGENAGSTLAHGPIVRVIERLGSVAGGAFSMEKKLEIEGSWKRPRLRAIAFVQRRETMRIVGAASVDVR